MRRIVSALASTTAACSLLLSPVPARADTTTGFPSVNGAWGTAGPYAVSVQTESVTTFYYPSDIATNPLKHPVIIWGNGTGVTPAAYDALLRHWASHGFIVAAANTTQANSGTAMRAGIDRLTTLNGTSGSPFHGKVDLTRVGASGHSQGGAGAIQSSADSRVDTTVPIEPGPLASTSNLHGPTLYLAGQDDTVVNPNWVHNFYTSSTQVPAEFTELAGATHFTAAGDGGGFRGITTAWFRFELMGDEQARGIFFGPGCGICSGPTWLATERNPLALAIPGP
ncbi:alpha/beta hydrolase family protein [Actinomadura rupiterrae]|uniref:alpha/beta hydrolase family protein n=1 Tax=Actinomadura rupiterrae TaxID=559627 RepID=UPI0020A2D319|nr:acetylxylan esterase [Actinomadura rupiterrae]MCP2342122.1 pimeloyl-ACP methyl ester carboxylesterase [Actinomadura rupiterrae]